MSGGASPDENILNNDGDSISADGSTSSESLDSGEAEQEAQDKQNARKVSLQYEGPNASSWADSCHQRRTDKLRGHLNKAYRNLVNSAIEETAGIANDDIEPLPPSQVGACFWSSEEKETLFSILPRTGPHELKALSRRIATKTEAEVSAYLLLLQSHIPQNNSKSSQASDVDYVSEPAAHEVGDLCESALDNAAEALNQHVFRHEIEMEKQRFGKHWIIDESYAAKIEGSLQRQQDPSVGQTVSERSRISGLNKNNGLPDTQGSIEEGYQGKTEVRVEDADNLLGQVPDILFLSLLRPEQFLQLSRSFFMNSATEPESNWSNIGTSDVASPTPAIFRSAFDDFYNMAVDFTRRTVHASLFQATSRLRAKDGRNPEAVVTEDDVMTALELLDFKLHWKQYWATIARRCGVDVYSEADRFNDGRAGTKTGYMLTREEVEAELGLASDISAVTSVDNTHIQSGRPSRGPSISDGESHAEGSSEESFNDEVSKAESRDWTPETAQLSSKRKRTLGLQEEEPQENGEGDSDSTLR